MFPPQAFSKGIVDGGAGRRDSSSRATSGLMFVLSFPQSPGRALTLVLARGLHIKGRPLRGQPGLFPQRSAHVGIFLSSRPRPAPAGSSWPPVGGPSEQALSRAFWALGPSHNSPSPPFRFQRGAGFCLAGTSVHLDPVLKQKE